VAEVNNGGEMVEHTLRVLAPHIPYKAVHASRGKAIRAEPVSALYEQGLVHHVGAFPRLEDQLCTFTAEGEGASPDRLDALVWGLSELMVHEGAPVIATSEHDFVCEPIALPPGWPRAYALALSRERVAVVWGALNTLDDTLYIYAEHAAPRGDLALPAAAIRDRGRWIPGVFAPKAGRSAEEGGAILARLDALDLSVEASGVEDEVALDSMLRRIAAGRLRVFRTLARLAAEIRALRRDARGKLSDSELTAAAALLCAAAPDVACVEPKKPRSRHEASRSAWGA
ncbi:MAG: DNA-packaging protein, partial [Methylobacteriaceae bacterium]|nr:DNA-packaging protein [Methylobacteriaceae bacterium]